MATKKPAAKKPAGKSPASSRESATSLADLYDDTDTAEASNLLSPGEKEVRLNKMELREDPKKGAACIAEYEAIDGDEEGRKVRQMYKLTDNAGNKAQGMAFLKRDLELLGYENISGKQLKKTLAEITEEQPMVVINVKQNGQYTNAYLAGLAEGGADAEAAGEAEGEAEVEIEVGSRVKGEDADGDEYEGEVTKINEKKGFVFIDDEDGDEHKLVADTVALLDEAKGESEGEAGEAEIEVGSRVKYENDDGDEVEGEVTKINEKKGRITIKDDNDHEETIEADDASLELVEAEPEAEPEAEAEIEVGSRVKWSDDDGDEHEGEVKKINEKKGTLVIEDEDSEKHTVQADDASLELVEAD